MFAGKTSYLLRSLSADARCFEQREQRGVLIRSTRDRRYGGAVVAHSGVDASATLRELSVPIVYADENNFVAKLTSCAHDANFVYVDELQFFANDVPTAERVCDALRTLSCGKMIICAGLDYDYARKPFPIMAPMIASANAVERLHARCSICGRSAQYTARKRSAFATANAEDDPVGGAEKYEPRCADCHHAIA